MDRNIIIMEDLSWAGAWWRGASEWRNNIWHATVDSFCDVFVTGSEGTRYDLWLACLVDTRLSQFSRLDFVARDEQDVVMDTLATKRSCHLCFRPSARRKR
jgi:hypothetical protein